MKPAPLPRSFRRSLAIRERRNFGNDAIRVSGIFDVDRSSSSEFIILPFLMITFLYLYY